MLVGKIVLTILMIVGSFLLGFYVFVMYPREQELKLQQEAMQEAQKEDEIYRAKAEEELDSCLTLSVEPPQESNSEDSQEKA